MRFHDPDSGYVYCVLGSNGAVKVGMSVRPKGRIRDLRSTMRVAMVEIVDWEISRIVAGPKMIEQSILEALRGRAKPLSGQEWFIGADYEWVRGVVRSVRSTEDQIRRFAANRKEENMRRYAMRFSTGGRP